MPNLVVVAHEHEIETVGTKVFENKAQFQARSTLKMLRVEFANASPCVEMRMSPRISSFIDCLSENQPCVAIKRLQVREKLSFEPNP
jgi:hypothetical protein